jgi:hypothetical protein
MSFEEIPMRCFLRWIGLLLLASLIASPALALPAPMSDQELMEKSDLVALVRVLSVTCTSITKDEATGENLPGYLATLQVLDVKKGDAKRGDEVIVTWRAVPKSLLGPWTVYYYPGEEVVRISQAERGRELRLDLVERQGRRR